MIALAHLGLITARPGMCLPALPPPRFIHPPRAHDQTSSALTAIAKGTPSVSKCFEFQLRGSTILESVDVLAQDSDSGPLHDLAGIDSVADPNAVQADIDRVPSEVQRRFGGYGLGRPRKLNLDRNPRVSVVDESHARVHDDGVHTRTPLTQLEREGNTARGDQQFWCG